MRRGRPPHATRALGSKIHVMVEPGVVMVLDEWAAASRRGRAEEMRLALDAHIAQRELAWRSSPEGRAALAGSGADPDVEIERSTQAVNSIMAVVNGTAGVARDFVPPGLERGRPRLAPRGEPESPEEQATD